MDISNDCTAASATKKKKKNKKKSKLTSNQPKAQADMVDAMMNHHVIRHGENHAKSIQKKIKNNKNKNKDDDSFWSSTNNTEERQKIREFWLQLGEEERRSLVKVEKEAVLRKMKEQQKHSCNCSVCGKKRTAIEDELEVLYDAYYEELEQYANHQQQTRGSSSSALASLPRAVSYIHGRIYHNGYDDTLDEDEDEEDDEDDEDEDDDDLDILGDEDDEDDEDDEEDEEEDEEDNDFDDQHDLMTRPSSPYSENTRFDEITHIRHTPSKSSSTNGDHFSFGNSLTVKGGILTVADDLLKNDGKKFLDMMERLAERRMQKDVSLDQNTNYFQEEEEGDEDGYEDDEDEDTRTEEQRMEEGRRMFQIFAARMFEQRVLAAYREKVAQERQQRLLEELEEEDRLREERETKKQLEREKKKDKKRQLKKQQEEEKLAIEAKKKAEEEALRKQKEKKLEQERQKRENERIKKEEERRLREEDRQKKEEERKRKAKEDKEREKKLREKKEKERKEKAEKAEKERKEKAEKAEKERKEKAEKEENEHKLMLEKERKIKEEQERQAKKEQDEEHLKQRAQTTNILEKPPALDDFESRQQVLIEALVGSSSRQPNFSEQAHAQPHLPQLQPPSLPHQPLSHLHQPPPFMPISRHLGGAPAPFASNSLEHTSPLSDQNSNTLGLFNSRSATTNASLLSETPSIKRSITPIAPIGQPLHTGRRPSSAQPSGTIGSLPDDTFLGSKRMDSEGGTARSFFSSFLFGEPSKYRTNTPMLPNDYDVRMMQDNRRFSCDSPGPSNWTNGWTASTLLSDNVHPKLFGDALPDRTTMTLERAKVAYQKLNEITQVKMYTEYHTLVQLHLDSNAFIMANMAL
ncbi:Stress response protein nst1 [Rhizopus stolonifer]|uniref:Stress response protein NST1 n=1 Tax=Rhizopus stolonifer TaxID=4846 RepID=A0A367KV76_RHIST|nr:Stress response protein nst1 [Rhizopus stolonifer]